MVKNILLSAGLWLLAVGAVTAQSNQRIDELLAQEVARVDTACYLALAAGGLIADDTDPAEAYDTAVAKGLIPRSLKADGTLSLENLAFLVMKSQKVPGGLSWTLFASPRAAYRELVAHDLLNTAAGPGRVVAGDEVIRVLQDARDLKGGRL